MGDAADGAKMQCYLDGELDFVIIATPDEVDAALLAEPSFDVIILDQRLERLGGQTFLDRLQGHSFDAERLIIVHIVDQAISEMIESDSRLMRLLHGPLLTECCAVLLRTRSFGTARGRSARQRCRG